MSLHFQVLACFLMLLSLESINLKNVEAGTYQNGNNGFNPLSTVDVKLASTPSDASLGDDPVFQRAIDSVLAEQKKKSLANNSAQNSGQRSSQSQRQAKSPRRSQIEDIKQGILSQEFYIGNGGQMSLVPQKNPPTKVRGQTKVKGHRNIAKAVGVFLNASQGKQKQQRSKYSPVAQVLEIFPEISGSNGGVGGNPVADIIPEAIRLAEEYDKANEKPRAPIVFRYETPVKVNEGYSMWPGKNYGPPRQSKLQSERQNQNYGPPSQVSTSYGPPGETQTPNSNYGPPGQNKPSSAPRPSYGPPGQSGPSTPPAQNYGPPSQVSNTYGPPEQNIPTSTPTQSYGPPSQVSTSYGPPGQTQPPSSNYGPPEQIQVTSPPLQTYGPPQIQPSQNYGPHRPNFSPPPQNTPPRPSYGPPPQNSAPNSNYAPPSAPKPNPSYGPPAQNQAQNPSYGPPAQSKPPVLPNPGPSYGPPVPNQNYGSFFPSQSSNNKENSLILGLAKTLAEQFQAGYQAAAKVLSVGHSPTKQGSNLAGGGGGGYFQVKLPHQMKHTTLFENFQRKPKPAQSQTKAQNTLFKALESYGTPETVTVTQSGRHEYPLHEVTTVTQTTVANNYGGVPNQPPTQSTGTSGGYSTIGQSGGYKPAPTQNTVSTGGYPAQTGNGGYQAPAQNTGYPASTQNQVPAQNNGYPSSTQNQVPAQTAGGYQQPPIQNTVSSNGGYSTPTQTGSNQQAVTGGYPTQTGNNGQPQNTISGGYQAPTQNVGSTGYSSPAQTGNRGYQQASLKSIVSSSGGYKAPAQNTGNGYQAQNTAPAQTGSSGYQSQNTAPAQTGSSGYQSQNTAPAQTGSIGYQSQNTAPAQTGSIGYQSQNTAPAQTGSSGYQGQNTAPAQTGSSGYQSQNTGERELETLPLEEVFKEGHYEISTSNYSPPSVAPAQVQIQTPVQIQYTQPEQKPQIKFQEKLQLPILNTAVLSAYPQLPQEVPAQTPVEQTLGNEVPNSHVQLIDVPITEDFYNQPQEIQTQVQYVQNQLEVTYGLPEQAQSPQQEQIQQVVQVQYGPSPSDPQILQYVQQEVQQPEPEVQYGPVVVQQPDYGTPVQISQPQGPAQQQQIFVPVASQEPQYGPPAQQEPQYGPPAQQEPQYGPPAQQEPQYGPPAQQEPQYGPPAQQEQIFVPVSSQEPQYGPPPPQQVQIDDPSGSSSGPQTVPNSGSKQILINAVDTESPLRLNSYSPSSLDSDTHHQIIFVKAPTPPQQQTVLEIPPAQKTETQVYLLTKHEENENNIKVISPPQTTPSPPQVFFVRYAANAPKEPNNPFNRAMAPGQIPQRPSTFDLYAPQMTHSNYNYKRSVRKVRKVKKSKRINT